MDKAKLLEDRLGPEKFLAVADLRRDLWTGGFGGLSGGLALGLCYSFIRLDFTKGVHFVIKYPPRGRPRAMAYGAVLGSGAFFSFLGTQAVGIGSFHKFWRTYFFLKENETD